MSFLSKNTSAVTNTTQNNYDQRQVNDASGGGFIGSGNAFLTSLTSIDASNRSTSTSWSDSSRTSASWSDSSTHNTTTNNVGTDPGIAHIAALNDQLLGALGDQQGDTMRVIAGLGTTGIRQMGESATNLFQTSAANSAQAWSHTLDVASQALDMSFSAAHDALGASTGLAQGAMQTYQPADNKASDNMAKVMMVLGVAVVVVVLIASRK